ncbi:MAG: hypothetical protein KGZ82_08050 [Bacteroidales bacterium]|nr:hypothetical protein [Bacteroidales bacterium]
MEQRDYLLREIEKMGVLIRAFFGIFSGTDNREVTEPAASLAELKSTMLSETGFDLDTFISLEEADKQDYISGFVGFNVLNVELLADLLTNISRQVDLPGRQTYLKAALHLYSLCNISDKTYVFARENKIHELTRLIESDGCV